VAAVEGWVRGRGWGWVWGENDEVGALNALTPERIVTALRGVERGQVYDLGVTIDRSTFLPEVHAPTEVVAYRTPAGLAREGLFGIAAGGLSFNTSLVMLSDHAGTQLDGLCHATYGADDHWYNGYASGAYGFDSGPRRASAHNIPPVISPGVLVDVAGALDLVELPPGHPIGVADLRLALDRQHSAIEPGDVVLVRTGAMRHWTEAGCDVARFGPANTAGLTLAAARWLVEELGAIVVGSDTATVECVPAADGDNFHPVHQYLLIDQGVHLGELHHLEQLAADRTYRFTYVALTPKVRGTTAGFALRPIAVV
jgi:kynurenine formamidase